MAANVFTAIQPTMFSAANQTAQEAIGALNAINMDFDDKGVAVGDKVKVSVAPVQAATDFAAGAYAPTGDGRTAEAIDVEISASKKVSHVLTGEQLQSLQNGNTDADWIKQVGSEAIRSLLNLAEAEACLQIKYGASRAYGTAGTTPFASDLTPLTNARKILRDNGAPLVDVQALMNTDASLNYSNLAVNQNAYQAGENNFLTNGVFSKRFGFSIRESAGITKHTKGTAANATTDNAGYAVGATSLVLAAAGTGTIVAGDAVLFAGDSVNAHVVKTGCAAVSGATIVINKPGLKTALSAATKAITMTADYTPSFVFERSAIVGVCRPPIFPANATIKQTLIPTSIGLTILMLEIEQYGQTTWEWHLAYGFKAIKPDFIATILG